MTAPKMTRESGESAKKVEGRLGAKEKADGYVASR